MTNNQVLSSVMPVPLPMQVMPIEPDSLQPNIVYPEILNSSALLDKIIVKSKAIPSTPGTMAHCGVADALVTLKDKFGYNEFLPGQEDVINRILTGKSALAIFPTGAGKSLCYQLPALNLTGLTVVVSPLLALMQDQLSNMKKQNIPADKIDSTMTSNQIDEVKSNIRSGECKILLISPERLDNEHFRNFIKSINVSLLVIDEAHCISQWGHNFRPNYLKLPAYKNEFNIPQVLLLTATATRAVAADILKQFGLKPDAEIRTGFYRSNLALHSVPVTTNKRDTLLQLLQDSNCGPTIIYVTQQHTAEIVAKFVRNNGIDCKCYHAGLETGRRKFVQSEFMSGNLKIIVATIAFGMGIDKSDIRQIIHFDLPSSIEGYAQEIGRAGRDGKQANCFIIADAGNINTLKNFAYQSCPDIDEIEFLLKQIPRDGTPWRFMPRRLSNTTNIHELALDTLLVYLEMENIISSCGSFYNAYKISKIGLNPATVNEFSVEKQVFVDYLLRNEKITLDGFDRYIAVNVLDELANRFLIYFEASEATQDYAVANNNFDVSAVAASLYLKFNENKLANISKVDQMVEFVESPDCQSHRLSEHFSDSSCKKKCGHCSVCINGKGTTVNSITLPPLDAQVIAGYNSEVCDKLTAKNMPVSPKILTCFLCGIGTPYLTKIKAKSIVNFGKLENYPYDDVYNVVSSMLLSIQ